MRSSQQQLDQKNSEFWNELCGTIEAIKLGITDSSQPSLAKFDSWYLGFYPYLLPIVQPERMKGKKVLEIGLGYGTLGQQIAAAGADYTGMDLSQNPVDHMNYRLRLNNLPGRALQGNALAMPFPDQSFDFLVSIGCMHHTGNIQRCFEETYRVLKPEGVAIIMVYNKYSYRRWRLDPWSTFRELVRGVHHQSRPLGISTEIRRGDFDANSQGQAAPEVSLVSMRQIKRMLQSFTTVRCTKRNSSPLVIKGKVLVPRSVLLPTLGRLFGLDIYIEAGKGKAAA